MQNNKTFKVSLLVICLFAFLWYIHQVNLLKEQFVGNLKQKALQESFVSNNEVPNVNTLKPKNEEDNVNANINANNTNINDNNTNINDNNTNINANNTNANNTNANNTNANDDNCLFGCDNTEENTKKMDVDDMMKTIEETEKLCDMIEEKDTKRREREEIDRLNKQLELNKAFLIQQKSQNKQIEDLQKIVEDMTFKEDMNKVALEKCSGKSDQCISNKENQLSDIIKEKQQKSQKLKVNLNLDQFGNGLKKSLMDKLGASGGDADRLMDLINSNQINMNDLGKQRRYQDGSTNDSCPNCKIDLSKYIDRCKIPCNKCRDPAWGCPQDK